VRGAAVFGVAQNKWAETPVAAVVLKQGGSIHADELKQWINERVAVKFQQVSEVMILEYSPRSATGEILKREMRQKSMARNQ